MLRRVMISDELRLLFVHVQKTGGTTIDKRLAAVVPDARRIPRFNRHAGLRGLLREEPGLSTYWTFGFVRNPWARMLSWYRMVERFRVAAERGSVREQERLATHEFLAGAAASCPDFETFVMTGTTDWPRLRKPQVRYLESPSRRADFIGRQETLDTDLRQVFERFGLPWEPMESVNVDLGRPDYREVYTEATRRRVEELFAPDIEAFGYEF